MAHLFVSKASYYFYYEQLSPEAKKIYDATYDYTYTAYGALVANSRGETNRCVCAGCNMALHYLYQQCGLKDIDVEGAGSVYGGESGPHA